MGIRFIHDLIMMCWNSPVRNAESRVLGTEQDGTSRIWEAPTPNPYPPSYYFKNNFILPFTSRSSLVIFSPGLR